MIQVKNLTYTYPGADLSALIDINLEIRAGEFVLLAGPTGSGKSTFLYCLNGLIPHVLAGDIYGDIRIDGLCPGEMTVQELSRVVGTVFQNPENQIFMLKVEDDVAFGCENLMMPREEVIQRRDFALTDMGLTDMRHKDTMTLSGGMKQRLAISSIYAMGPKVFLFDEPTADLDSKGREGFIEVIRRLRKKGHTILLVEHRHEEFLPLVDRIISFEKGKTTEDPRAKNPVHPPALKPRHRSDCRDLEVHLYNVSFRYDRKGATLLEKMDLGIRKGEVVALSGDNSSGKTTLLKIIVGILKPTEGMATILGIKNPAIDDLIGKVGFLFQNPDEQLFARTVEDEIMFGPRQLGKTIDIAKRLHEANLTQERKRHPHSLSRGQRQLLAVLSVLATEPRLLLLDEPTTGLDEESWHNLFSILYELAHKGSTIIFTTHHPRAMEYADRLIHIDRGGRLVNEIPD